MDTYTFKEFFIPDNMMDSVRRYIERGIPPGSFLTAIINNDLAEAVGNADDINLRNIPAYIGYFYNCAPSACWGRATSCKEWVERFNITSATVRSTFAIEYMAITNCEKEIAIARYYEHREYIDANPHGAAKEIDKNEMIKAGDYEQD